MDNTQPTGEIKPQILTDSPITLDGTLVDDPTALVDDPNVLTGSQTTQIPELKASTGTNAPSGAIKQRR